MEKQVQVFGPSWRKDEFIPLTCHLGGLFAELLLLWEKVLLSTSAVNQMKILLIQILLFVPSMTQFDIMM